MAQRLWGKAGGSCIARGDHLGHAGQWAGPGPRDDQGRPVAGPGGACPHHVHGEQRAGRHACRGREENQAACRDLFPELNTSPDILVLINETHRSRVSALGAVMLRAQPGPDHQPATRSSRGPSIHTTPPMWKVSRTRSPWCVEQVLTAMKDSWVEIIKAWRAMVETLRHEGGILDPRTRVQLGMGAGASLEWSRWSRWVSYARRSGSWISGGTPAPCMTVVGGRLKAMCRNGPGTAPQNHICGAGVVQFLVQMIRSITQSITIYMHIYKYITFCTTCTTTNISSPDPLRDWLSTKNTSSILRHDQKVWCVVQLVLTSNNTEIRLHHRCGACGAVRCHLE